MATESIKATLSPAEGTTPSLGAELGADSQLQSIIHEFSEYNRCVGRTEYGQWGVEYKSESEIVIHNDYIANFYGFSTVYENRYEIKICNKIAKVNHIYNYFHQPSMWIHEAEKNYTVKNIEVLKKFIALAQKFAKEGKAGAFDTVCEALDEFLQEKKVPDFSELEKEAEAWQVEYEDP
jgi:hypothetical protein